MAEMQDFESEEIGEIEAVEQKAEQIEPKVEDILPEKYRGKGVEDLVKMHQEAEKLVSRQAQEVGEVRKLADELIKSQLQKKPEEDRQPEVDFFANPDEAIRRAVESNPKVVQAEQYALMAQRALAKQRFDQMHPDAAQIVQDPEFANYVMASKVRSNLYKQAHEGYDLEAADELLSTFKALKSVKQTQVSEVEKTTRTKTMQAAAVDTGGTGESGRKVYRRADLIRLKMNDPARYEEMGDEILAAYREGRVK